MGNAVPWYWSLPRRSRRRLLGLSAVVVAALAIAVLHRVRQNGRPAVGPAPALEEYSESYGLASRLLSFAVDNGGRFPDRLEEMAAAGKLDGRPLSVLRESKDGSTIYRVGDLNVVYLGAGQRLTDTRERVVARVLSSVDSDMTYEIGSNGLARIVMEWQTRRRPGAAVTGPATGADANEEKGSRRVRVCGT